MKISILGTEYEIIEKDESDDPILKDRDGYYDCSIKVIVLSELTPETDSKKDLTFVKRNILRHEIVHAFMFESGLDVNSEWGSDETLVDWIALQFPKMLKAFEETGCI